MSISSAKHGGLTTSGFKAFLVKRLGPEKNIPNLENEVYEYTLKDIGDAHLLYMSSAYAKDNSSTRIFAVFPSHSGIWRVCNYLSSESLSFG